MKIYSDHNRIIIELDIISQTKIKKKIRVKLVTKKGIQDTSKYWQRKKQIKYWKRRPSMKFRTVGKKKLNQLLKKLQSNVERTLENTSETYKNLQNSQKETTDNRWHLSEKIVETKDWFYQRVHCAKEKRNQKLENRENSRRHQK